MNITDEMLYAAAPEAAERWLNTLPGREDCGHDFSLTFEASMAALLRRRRRKRWKTLALLAAVIAALTALLVGVGAERKDDYRVYAAQDDGFVTYVIRPREDPFSHGPHRMTPGWLPESYVVEESVDLDLGFRTRYVHSGNETKYITLYQRCAGDDAGTLLGDYEIEDVQVDGKDALLLSETGGERLLLWSNGPNVYKLFSGSLEKEDLLHIANNLKW